MEHFDTIKNGTTLLTPNRRLAATLFKAYNEWQTRRGTSCWLTLDILPFTSWIERTWQTCCSETLAAHPVILTPHQELILWEDIVRQSTEGQYLLQISRTAELAKSAWALLKQWRVSFDHPLLRTTEDNLIFQKWAEQFQRLCQKNTALDTHSLVDQVANKIESKQIKPPQHIVLTGFTELSPQQKHLLHVCEQFGSDITHGHFFSLSAPQKSARVSLENEETEIRTMALWAKNRLARHPTDPIKIGCVIPRLETIRDDIIRIFSAVFMQDYGYTLNPTILPFNISAGKSLADYPVIHMALQIWNLTRGSISLNDCCQLLRSPFLGEAESEMLQRAQLESVLRRNNVLQLSLRDCAEVEKYAPCLAARLKRFYAVDRDLLGGLPTGSVRGDGMAG